LYKFTQDDVRVVCPVTHQWCIVSRTAAKWLQQSGTAHPGEAGYTLADGATFDDVEAELVRLGFLP
jgi:hypothetical protein